MGGVRSARHVTAGIPFLASCDHGVEDDDQLAHAGDDGNLRLFSFGNQALIVGLQHGVVQRGCANTGHVDSVTDPAVPPVMWRSPRRFPLSSSQGATPLKAAAISSLTWPSSGIPA